MIALQKICLLTVFVLTGCAVNSSRSFESGVVDRERQPECLVGSLYTNGRQVSTVFKLSVEQDVVYLTTEHSVARRPRDSYVVFKCGTDESRVKVESSEALAGMDVALLGLAQQIKSMPQLSSSPVSRNDPIRIPYFPDWVGVEGRIAGLPIQAEGRIISEREGILFYTSSLSRIGASGAPVIDKNGYVVAVSTGRLMEENIYVGVSYGVPVARIVQALGLRGAGQRDVNGRRVQYLQN